MATIKPVTVPSKRLSTSISASDSSFKLNNILGWDGVNLSSASFGTKLYCVFRNSAGTLMELMEIDPATIVSATAAITILQRGLNFNGDYTTPVTANKLSWVKGDTIVELGTHIPQLLAHYVDNLADQSIDGIKTFLKTPASSGGNPINATDLVIKSYVDALVLGTLTTLDVIVPGTADATITAGQVVYLKTSNGRWALASASAAATSENVLLGIAQGAGAAAGAITSGVLLQGSDALQSGLVTGTVMYLSNTPGAIATSAGTKSVVVGIAKDATHLYFDPRFDQQLTQDLIDALGGTSGTPSASNKFVTNADTTGTGSLVRSSITNAIAKFGGDGSDGALTVASGTTTIDCANAAVVVKQYTSISVSAGATLAFSNPHTGGTLIILKSQGSVVIAGTINASAMGAAGGAGGGPSAAGNNGTIGNFILDDTATHYGGLGGTSGYNVGTAGAAGAAGAIYTNKYLYSNQSAGRLSRGLLLACGSGGGGGGGTVSAGGTSTTGGTGGNGGRGGGAVLIECSGALNFSGTINVSGANGTNGAQGTGSETAGGGGGGGGATGQAIVLYNTLTANTGTITASGGAGGTGGTQNVAASGTSNAGGGGGAGGGSYTNAGGAGGAGGAGAGGAANAGAAGSTGGVGAGGGGGGGGSCANSLTAAGGASGAAGSSEGGLVAQNYYFA